MKFFVTKIGVFTTVGLFICTTAVYLLFTTTLSNEDASAGGTTNVSLITGTTISNVSISPAGPGGLQDSLVGHWTFDGKDLAQNAVDRSGQNNTGYLTSFTSTTTAIGAVGQALRFNGSTNFVNIGNNSSLEAQLPFTVSVWIKPETVGGAVNMGIVENDNFATSQANYYGFQLQYGIDGGVDIHYGDGTGGLSTDRRSKSGSTANLPLNRWHHAVAVVRGATDMTIYINGVDNGGTYSGTGGSIAYSANSGSIGRGIGGFFPGAIDDVRIYNRALSASEVKQLYALGAATKIASSFTPPGTLQNGLVGWYTFDGSKLTQNAVDSSGQGKTGYLTNFTSTTTAPGALGQALSFDGVDDSVSNIGNVGNIKTVAFWMKAATTTATASIIDTGSAGNATIETNSGGIVTATNFTSPTIYVDGSSTSALIPDLRWHQVVVTTDTAESAAAFVIGKANNLNFGGSLDDVRIYNRVLTTDEVKQLYNLGR